MSCCIILPTDIWVTEVSQKNKVLITQSLNYSNTALPALSSWFGGQYQTPTVICPLETAPLILTQRHLTGLPQSSQMTSIHSKFSLTQSKATVRPQGDVFASGTRAGYLALGERCVNSSLSAFPETVCFSATCCFPLWILL